MDRTNSQSNQQEAPWWRLCRRREKRHHARKRIINPKRYKLANLPLGESNTYPHLFCRKAGSWAQPNGIIPFFLEVIKLR
ncbi:unnamed protein product [Caretta caretta]